MTPLEPASAPVALGRESPAVVGHRLAGGRFNARRGGSPDGPAVDPGDRVRVTSPALTEGLLTGTMVAVESDTLVVRASPDSAPTRVPIASITRLEMGTDEGSRWARGIGIGFAVGAAIGALYGAVRAGTGDGGIDLPTSHAMGLGGLIAGAGGAVGAARPAPPCVWSDGNPFLWRRSPSAAHPFCLRLCL